ncbi:hypothetical protein [Streptomyces albospinus]|nr:hypothetical protein [Streptomyces albospinus]
MNGTHANTGVKLNTPAGVSTSVNSNTNVGVDVLTDLVASVSGVVKL